MTLLTNIGIWVVVLALLFIALIGACLISIFMEVITGLPTIVTFPLGLCITVGSFLGIITTIIQ